VAGGARTTISRATTSAPAVAPPVQRPATPLHLTQPHEPEEIAADRFAEAALGLVKSTAIDGFAARAPLLSPTSTAPSVQAAAPAPPVPAAPMPAPAPEPAREESAPIEGEKSLAHEKAVAPASAGTGAGSGGTDGAADTDATSDDDALLERRSAGTPLAADLRARIEPLIGMDLGRVRVHADTEAADLASRFSARAFTHDDHVYFAPGEYAPSTQGGLHLLLHELAHVAQDSEPGHASRTIARKLSGNGVHSLIQNAVLERHNDVIAEGVLPGGNTGAAGLNELGFPDLYWSPSGKVPWVRGKKKPHNQPGINYAAVTLPKKRQHPQNKHGDVPHEPETAGGGKPFKGDFPTEFFVAEIKPVDTTRSVLKKLGEGFAQSGNYVKGFPAFCDQARKDGKSNNVPGDGQALINKFDKLLPPSVDYRNFETEAAKDKPDRPEFVINTSQGKRRYWVYPMKTRPLLLYFDLKHPNNISDLTKLLDQRFNALEKDLKEPLSKKPPRTKKKTKKFKAASGPARPRAALRRIPRKTDWKAEHKAWEEKRVAWDKDAAPFLTSETGKALADKAKVDKKLGLGMTDDWEGYKRNRKLRQIELFSGKTGKILGDVRFALAPLFEKIEPLFDWLGEKLGKLVGKLKNKRSVSFSWTKTIVNAVLAALYTTLDEAISLLFGKFQDCLWGMVDQFLDSFKADLGERLAEPFENAKKAFFEWLGTDEASFGKVMDDLKASIEKYEKIIETLTDLKRLADEAAVYEWVIRGIVQAVSCLSPPGLGCLWGLVAQMGLPAIVSIAAESDLFQRKVVRPLVKDLVKDILDEPFSRIVSASIEAIGLREYAVGVEVCKVKPIVISQIVDRVATGGLPMGSAGLREKRDEWEKLNETILLDEALKKFVTKDGKPLTKEELKKLLAQVKDLVPEAGTMQEAVKDSTRADGKIDAEKFAEWARGSRKAKPGSATTPGGGFTDDKGGTPSPDEVKKKLEGLDLGGAVPIRLVEILEDSREDGGKVNVDQFARKVGKHLERQQLKRDIEANEPSRPGVPKQPGRGFGGASPETLADLLKSLANANLGEEAGVALVLAATNAEGQVDATKAKGDVDKAAAGKNVTPPQTQPGAPSPGKDGPAETKKGGRCDTELCVEKSLGDEDLPGPRVGPVRIGPQVLPSPGGEGGQVLPGAKIEFDITDAFSKKK
jgi:hypothetical protein